MATSFRWFPRTFRAKVCPYWKLGGDAGDGFEAYLKIASQLSATAYVSRHFWGVWGVLPRVMEGTSRAGSEHELKLRPKG